MSIKAVNKKSVFKFFVILNFLVTAGILLCGKDTATNSKWQMGRPIINYWAGPAPITDFAAKQMAEGGFNLAWVSGRGKPRNMSYLDYYRKQLDILHKYKVRALLSPGFMRKDSKTKIYINNLTIPKKKEELTKIINALKDHPALYAYSIKDEPGVKLFSMLAEIKEYIMKLDPKHLVYINLLPNYAKNRQLGTVGNRVEAYKQYLAKYIAAVKPQLLCFDHYRFSENGDTDAYFLNMAQIRAAALRNEIPFMAILQASSWVKSYKIPTCEQLRWQAYTLLAYGGQGISWYIYSWPGHDGGFAYSAGTYREREIRRKFGPVVLPGKPTPLYYFVKDELHKEFLNIATVLQPLKSIAVYHAGMIPEGTVQLPKNAPFTFEPPVKQKACPGFVNGHFDDHNGRWPINSYEKPLEGFVIGYFGKNNKVTHALVVNLDQRTYGGAAQPRRIEFIIPVNRKIVGPGPLEVFDAQTGKWKAGNGNKAVLRLAPGAGILVRLTEK